MLVVPKVVIPAPYWGQPGHLGWVRVERFVRWLGAAGFEVVVVRAGSRDRSAQRRWGTEITVRDPIGFFTDLPQGSVEAIPPRPKNLLRRYLAYVLLVPDPVVAWARRAASRPSVREAIRGADWVLASSPPESAHVAAYRLAGSEGARLLVDLRDGWLDEPTLPLVPASRVQTARHRRLEARILQRAERIVVTSEGWRRLLTERLPWTAERVTVLTNAYPELPPSAAGGPRASEDRDRRLMLLYAGKLFSSRSERRIEHLLEPIERGIRRSSNRGRLLFVGNLDVDERHQLGAWGERLTGSGWTVEVRPPVSRNEALQLMASADGLLLLSSSSASIPAKLFDYLAVQRPILAVAPRGSAVWEIGVDLPQVTLVALGDTGSTSPCRDFVEHCRVSDVGYDLPADFSEEHLRTRFLALFGRDAKAESNASGGDRGSDHRSPTSSSGSSSRVTS